MMGVTDDDDFFFFFLGSLVPKLSTLHKVERINVGIAEYVTVLMRFAVFGIGIKGEE